MTYAANPEALSHGGEHGMFATVAGKRHAQWVRMGGCEKGSWGRCHWEIVYAALGPSVAARPRVESVLEGIAEFCAARIGTSSLSSLTGG